MEQLNKSILDIRLLLDKQANKDIMPILQAYKRSLDDVRTEIAKIYTKYAVNGKLSVSQTQRYTILKQLEQLLKEQGQQIGMIDVDHTTKILSNIFSESYYQTAYTIDKGIESILTFTILKPEMVAAAVNTPIEGKMYSDRIWKNKTLLINRVRRAVEQGMIQGMSIDKLSRAVKKEFDVSAFESKRLILTELARVQSQASDSIYKQSSVINKVMYDATLDVKTSSICRSLDGKIFDADADYPKPPQHPSCRSSIVPVIEGWSPTRKKENVKNDNGVKQVIDYATYQKWRESKGIS
jgi:SPP1 gp7 family putative phage head morphogenesis protein